MTDQERVDEIEARYPAGNVDADDVRELLGIVRRLQGVADQQAGWLREVTLERDALKMRVEELEQQTLPNCPNCNHPSWACRRCGHWK